MQRRHVYDTERAVALQTYLATADGKAKYEQTTALLRVFYKVTEPDRFEKAAHDAAVERITRLDFHFPEYTAWALTRQTSTAALPASIQ